MYVTRHDWSRVFLHARPTRHISISCPQPPRLRHSCPYWRERPIPRGSDRLVGLRIIPSSLLSYRPPCVPCACGTQIPASAGQGPVPQIGSVIGQGTEMTLGPPSSPSKTCFRVQICHCPTGSGLLWPHCGYIDHLSSLTMYSLSAPTISTGYVQRRFATQRLRSRVWPGKAGSG